MFVADGGPDCFESIRLLLVLLSYGPLSFDAKRIDGPKGSLDFVVSGVAFAKQLWF